MNAPFNTAFIMSGGGTRLMIYLGMFAALEALGRKPDVLIGTCGGALAATVINTFPNQEARREYLKSREYYAFTTNVALTAQRKLWNIGLLSLRKIYNKQNAPFLENLFGTYLVEMEPDLGRSLPALRATAFSETQPTLIIGAEILYTPQMAGQKRKGRKLFQKVVFTDAKTAATINPNALKLTPETYKNSAVADAVKLKTDVSMLQSTRISIADMFYIAPVSLEGHFFAGGAIDLVPVELAQHLAAEVIVEEKQPYSAIEESFVRAVLGYSGNARLAEAAALNPAFTISTHNIKKALEGFYLKKKIVWNRLQVGFSYPKNYEAFREAMDQQWEYGYAQTLKSVSGRNLDTGLKE